MKAIYVMLVCTALAACGAREESNTIEAANVSEATASDLNVVEMDTTTDNMAIENAAENSADAAANSAAGAMAGNSAYSPEDEEDTAVNKEQPK